MIPVSDRPTADIRVRFDRLHAAVTGSDWTAADCLARLGIPSNVMTKGSAVSTGAQVSIQAARILDQSDAAKECTLPEFLTLTHRVLIDRPGEDPNRIINEFVSQRDPRRSELAIREALSIFTQYLGVPLDLSQNSVATTDLETPAEQVITPCLPPVNVDETDNSAALRGHQISYVECPRKAKWRLFEIEVARRSSTASERATGHALFLGSATPQIQGELIANSLGVPRQHICTAEREPCTIPFCRAECERNGYSFVAGDVADVLPSFLARRGAKFIFLDFHQNFGDDIEAVLERLDPKTKDPLIVSVTMQGKRETPTTRELQFLGPHLVNGSAAMTSTLRGPRGVTIGKTVEYRKDMVRLLAGASGEIESGELSSRLKEEGVTHQDARVTSLYEGLAGSIAYNFEPFGDAARMASLVEQFGGVVETAARRAFRQHPDPNRETTGVRLSLEHVLAIETLRFAPGSPIASRYVSTSGKGGTPMVSVYCRFDSLDNVLSTHLVEKQLARLRQDLTVHGLNGLDVRVEFDQPKKDPSGSRTMGWPNPFDAWIEVHRNGRTILSTQWKQLLKLQFATMPMTLHWQRSANIPIYEIDEHWTPADLDLPSRQP